MDSQRRHDLETNSLSTALSQSPAFLKKHANTLLILVAVIAVGVLIYQYRARAAARRQQEVRESLQVAYAGVRQLDGLPMIDPETYAQQRDTLERDVLAAADGVLAEPDAADAKLLAAALLLKGELHWTLSQLPPLEAAATRPTLAGPTPPAEHLTQSADAYTRVLSQFPADVVAAREARFAKGDTASARAKYDALKADADMPQAYRDLAGRYLELLDRTTASLYLAPGTPPEPTSRPTTDATSQPATLPATAPTTRP
jgi:hypothetical protein